MALAPLIQEDNRILFQIIYSLLFFTLAGFVALKPNKLKNLLGKFMTPVLLILILIVFLGTIFMLPASVGAPYARCATFSSFIRYCRWLSDYGYFSCFKFWRLSLLSIFKILGVKNQKRVAIEIMKAGFIAGLLLAVGTNCATGYVGMHTSGMFDQVSNGAQVLVYAIENSFGSFAQILVGLLSLLDCMFQCVYWSIILLCTIFSRTYTKDIFIKNGYFYLCCSVLLFQVLV